MIRFLTISLMMVLTTVGGFLVNGQSPATSADSLVAQAALDSLPPIEKMPAVVTFVNADYPDSIIRQGIQGDVVMDVIVSDSGRVDSVAVVKGLHPVLDSAAVAAMRKFVLTPAIAGGVGVPVLWQYAYHFTFEALVDSIAPVANFGGILLERGTRAPVVSAMVVVTFIDTVSDSLLTVPFRTYIKKIATFGNQHIEENSLVTTTDSLGRFQFYSLPTCEISVRFPIPGYETVIDTTLLKRDTAQTITYRLQRLSYSDYEIVVYGKTKEKEVAHHALTINEVKRIPGLGGDAVKVVQALPGVARASFTSGAVVVRGASSSDSRFFIDGIQLPVLYHFGGLKSTYNSNALESVEFYPGGFGTRYGNVTAGVIELKTRSAKTDRFHGSLDLNLYDASFMVEGPLTKDLSFLLTARRSYVGDILGAVINNLDLPFTVQPYYWDYIGRLDYSLSKDNKFSLTLFGSQDVMKLITSQVRGGSKEISEASNQATQRTIFNMGILSWNSTISPALKNDFTYSFTYGDSYMSMFGFVQMTQRAWFNHLRDQVSISVTPEIRLNAGVDGLVYPVDLYLAMQSSADTISRDTIKNWMLGDVGLYANLNWKLTEQLEVIPGIRYDYFPELNYKGGVLPEYWPYESFNNRQGGPGEPAARLTVRYALTPLHTIKAAIGNYSQTPQPLGQAIMDKWGDPKLPSTKAAHYVAGYEWKITDLISADMQVYYNNQWNIPRTVTLAEKMNNPKTKGYVADQNGRMYGFELMLKHDQGKEFFGWLAYSLSRSERQNAQSGEWSLYSKDETHNIQLVGNFRLPAFWEVGFRMRYVTGDPTTPIIGKEYDETYAYYYALYGAKNSARMDPFFQLDLRVDKKFTFDNWTLSAYLDFHNVCWFFYKSPEFYMNNYDFTERMTVGDIPYPSLGVSAEF